MITKLKSKYKELSSVKKATIFFLFIDMFQKGMSLLTIPIFTFLLTPDQFGEFSVYQSWLTLLTILCTLYLWAGVFNKGLEKFSNDREGFINSIQSLITLITFVGYLIYIVFRETFENIIGLSPVLMTLIFTQILFSSSFNLWYARQRFEYKYINPLIITTLMAIMNPILGIILIMSFEDKAFGRILSVAIIQIIFGVILYIYITLKSKYRFNFYYWKYMLLFNIPLIPLFLSQVLLNQADLIMIERIVGTFEAGLYSVSYSMASILLIIAVSLSTSLMPWTYTKIKNKEFENIRIKSNLTMLLIFLISVLIIALVPEFVQVVFAEQYFEAIWLIPPLILSVFFIFLTNLFNNVEIYFEKTKFIMYTAIGIAVLNIILNALLIPKVGYIAAPYSTLFCYILNMLIHYKYLKHLLNSEYIKDNLYDLKTIIKFSVILFSLSFIMVLTYDEFIYRYVIIGLIIVWGIFKRKSIEKMFKQIIYQKNEGV